MSGVYAKVSGERAKLYKFTQSPEYNETGPSQYSDMYAAGCLFALLANLYMVEKWTEGLKIEEREHL